MRNIHCNPQIRFSVNVWKCSYFTYFAKIVTLLEMDQFYGFRVYQKFPSYKIYNIEELQFAIRNIIGIIDGRSGLRATKKFLNVSRKFLNNLHNEWNNRFLCSAFILWETWWKVFYIGKMISNWLLFNCTEHRI